MWVISQDEKMLANCNMFKIEIGRLKSKREICKELSSELGSHMAPAYIVDDTKIRLERDTEDLYMSPDNTKYLIRGCTAVSNVEKLAEYSTEATALKVLHDLSISTNSKETFIFPKDTDKATKE